MSDNRFALAPLSSLDPAEGIGNPLLRRLAGWGLNLLEPLLAFRQLDRIYQSFRRNELAVGEFFPMALKELGLTVRVSDEDRERIPVDGPVIVVSNHPFGGLDGIAMGSLLAERRGDSRLLVNYLLARLQGIESHVIAVDPFGGSDAGKRNLHGLRLSVRWLNSGGLLVVWPSGTVSHFQWSQRQVTDPQWAENLAGLIRRTRATVVPAYFPGRNGNLFQVAGLIHPALRTLLLPREMVRRHGAEIEIRIGNPISATRLMSFASDRQMMDFLRLRSYILQSRSVAEKVSFRRWIRRRHKRGAPVAPPQMSEVLKTEVESLEPRHRLVEFQEYAVYHARATDIPFLLKEIGRLREITFRKVGEGTGRAIDLDAFDNTYVHLFLWNHSRNELVGAYRLGLTDEILPNQGKHGLYTTTLFHYRRGVLDSLNPGIELGRSFIVEEYQRKHHPLGLIWRGIGQFVLRYPRYCILFGPVSISREYQSLSKNLIVQYLKETNLNPEFSSRIRARKPPRSRFFGSLDRHSFSRSVRDIDDVSALIAEIEREEKGIPVLLKQYLKLKATMLSFNVDPEFNECIDGLVLVDLRQTPVKILERYMGEQGAAQFLSYHEIRGRKVLPGSEVHSGD